MKKTTLSCFLASVLTLGCLAAPLSAAQVIKAPQVTNGDVVELPSDSIINEKGNGGYGIDVNTAGGTVKGGPVTINGNFSGIRASAGSPVRSGTVVVDLDRVEMNLSDFRTGIFANVINGETTVSIGDGSKITTDQMVLQIEDGAKMNVGNDSLLRHNGQAAGNVIDANNGIVTIGNRAMIEQKTDAKDTNKFAKAAVMARGGSGNVTIGDNSVIRADNNFSQYHAVEAGLEGKKGNVSIGNDATISTKGNQSFGLFGNAVDSDIKVGNDTKVSTKGDKSFALFSYAADSDIVIGDRAVLTTAGKESAAVRSGWLEKTKETPGGVITVGENATITTTGEQAYGAEARGTGSSVTVKTGSTITTEGKTSHGATAASKGVTNLEDVKITTSGEGSIGVLAGGYILVERGVVNVKDGINVTTTGKNAHGIAASYGGLVNLEGNVEVAVDSSKGAYAIGAKTSTKNNGAKVTGQGLFTVTGDIGVDTNGQVDLTFNEGSQFDGATRMRKSDASTAIGLNMTNSTWNMTDTSWLTNLKLSGTSVDMRPAKLGATLTADSLSGEGLFFLKTDIGAGSGDKVIATQSEGDHKLTVENNPQGTATGHETLTVVETGDGIGKFDLTNDVSVGAWLYGLRRTAENENNWELYNKNEASPGGSAAVNTFGGAYLLAYAETQTLMQRLGDLRETGFEDGYWFRAYGGKFESNSSSFVKDFDMDYGGVQIGYDHKLEKSWFKGGDTYVGAFLGYGRGDLDYGVDGSGTVDSRTMGMYGTYVKEDGFYADAVVKYMWMKNDFDVLDTDGSHITGGDLNTGGVGASLELGKRFRFHKNATGGNWYVEPQLQYSYTHQDGGYYNASNGMRIGVDSFTSSIVRAGALIGYETAKTNFYAKASYVKEFDGDVNIMSNGENIPESFGDNWWVFGVGFTSQMNERNSIYMSVERSDGGRFDEPWKVYGGWRISF